MTNCTISFIILTWNSKQYIYECIHSIINKCSEENICFEIVIVDNGSTDTTKDIIQGFIDKYPDKFNTIFLEKNRGTTYPRNIALKKAKGNYFIIADSDICILSGSLTNALQYLKENKNVGILAPALYLPAGEIQHSVKKFPTFFHKVEKTRSFLIKQTSKNLDFYSDFPFTKTTNVDSAISAFWILRSNLLQEIGLLDEKIFYAPEDLDYCLRVWKAGKRIVYYPELKVLHNTQQITHKNPFSIISFKHFIDLVYYFLKHGGWFSTKNICKRKIRV